MGLLDTAARFNAEYLPRIYDWALVLYSTGSRTPRPRLLGRTGCASARTMQPGSLLV